MQREHKPYNHESTSFAEAIDIDINELTHKMIIFQESLQSNPLNPSRIVEKLENLDLTRRELAFLFENNAEILRLARDHATKSPLFQFSAPMKVEREEKEEDWGEDTGREKREIEEEQKKREDYENEEKRRKREGKEEDN